MGVRITEDREVALYDSVTGHAFGRVFENAALATDFLDWFEAQIESGEIEVQTDLRMYRDSDLDKLIVAWDKDSAWHGR
jgi:hypothetical protein